MLANGYHSEHSDIPWAKRIELRWMADMGLENGEIARLLGLRKSAVTMYLNAGHGRFINQANQHRVGPDSIDIPLDQLSPRAQRLYFQALGEMAHYSVESGRDIPEE